MTKIGSTLPPEARRGGELKRGGFVTLPFDYVNLTWYNGNSMHGGNVPKHGGWIAEPGAFDTELARLGMTADDTGFILEQILKSNQGVHWYCSRTIYFAYIGRQELWLQQKQDGVPTGKKYKRSSLLGYLARYTEDAFVPLAPVVLLSFNWVANYIQESIVKWAQYTLKARNDFAETGLSPWLFWAPIGTWGKETTVIQVPPNRKTNTSPITPCYCFEPDGGWTFTEEVLGRYYVGNEIASLMADYQRLAEEWFEVETKQREREAAGETETQPQAQAQSQVQQTKVVEQVTPLDEELDDDIPF